VNLDDTGAFATVDRSGALSDVVATAEQWAQARSLSDTRLDLDGVDVIVVTGMGGSGICGDVLWALALERYPLPVVVHKGYGLPAFVGPRSLVIAVSYSGKTEETASAYEQAAARGARRFAVAGGGTLGELCGSDGTPCVRVPGGGQPRHSLGYLLVPALTALGLDDGLDEAIDVLHDVAADLGPDVPTSDNPAKRLAEQLAAGGVPLILGGRGLGSVAAYSLKCQLNENAKQPALQGELPEADHNEVVAWQEATLLSGRSGLVQMRDRLGETQELDRRFDVTVDVLGDGIAFNAQVQARGRSPLARVASLLLHADLVSIYTALALDRDPTPIPSIDRLKAALAQAPA
jgi:glucose/mannose-6-phosphate isomerase